VGRDDGKAVRSGALVRLSPGLLAGATAVGFAAWSGQLFVLIVGLALAFLLLLWKSDPSSAFTALLVETSLLDRITLPVHGANIRPEVVVAVPTLLFIATSMLRSRVRPGWLVPDLFLLGWLALNGFASLLAPDPLLALKEWVSLLLSASAYYFIRWLTRDRLREAVRLLLVLGAAVCGLGIAAYLVSPLGFLLGTQLNRDAHVLMATGTLKEADIFGSFAACLLLLSAGCIVTRQPDKRLAWLALASSAVALAASLARTPWLAALLGAACGMVVWRHDSYARSVRVVASASAIAIAGGIVLSLMGTSQPRSTALAEDTRPTVAATVSPSMEGLPAVAQASSASDSRGVVQRLRSLLDLQTDPTVQGRLHAASLAIADWRKSPLVGRGTASFGQVYTDSSHQPAWIFNIELRALHDTGLIGLLLFGSFSIGLTLMALRPKSGPAGDLTNVLLVAALVLWIAAQGTEPFQLMWPWILLGLLASAVASSEPDQALTQRSLAYGGNPTAPESVAG